MSNTNSNWMETMARIGLSAKGIVYCLIGILILLTLQKGKGSAETADKGGVFLFIQDLPAGQILLGIVVIGLLCYTAWRFVQTFKNGDAEEHKIVKRIRYASSGLVYGGLSFYGARILMHQYSGGGSGNEDKAREVLQLDGGQWLLGAGALFMAGVGIYQIYYGLSEKYKKHVSGLSLAESNHRLLLFSGKAGYLARGVVWLILAFLLAKAALHANAQEAGSTGEAFRFLENATYGPYLLGALAGGLFCYGVFNFIRARFEYF